MFKKEYIFSIPSNLAINFVKIDRYYESPTHLDFAMIELLDDQLNYLIIQKLNDLLCRNICLVIDKPNNIENILSILKSDFFFETVSFIIKCETIEFKVEYLKEKYSTLDSINFYNNIFKEKSSFFIPKFQILLELYNEAQKNNNFFNKRIFINKKGHYSSSISDKEFSKDLFINTQSLNLNIWNISKDQCFVCKDCEFRYMCIDNRIPEKAQDDMYYYAEECSYNPFISKWSNEVDFHKLDELGISPPIFNVDIEIINDKNVELWE